MKLHHKIVSILLAIAILNFNLAVLPAMADGCRCDHPHGDGEFACYCGISKKDTCDSTGKTPSFSRRQCGPDKKSDDFYVPALEHPTLLSAGIRYLTPHLSILKKADGRSFYNADLLPVEHPPSIL